MRVGRGLGYVATAECQGVGHQGAAERREDLLALLAKGALGNQVVLLRFTGYFLVGGCQKGVVKLMAEAGIVLVQILMNAAAGSLHKVLLLSRSQHRLATLQRALSCTLIILLGGLRGGQVLQHMIDRRVRVAQAETHVVLANVHQDDR